METKIIDEQLSLALGRSPPVGLVAKATFAGDLVVERRLTEAEEVVKELERSDEGVAALVDTLRDQSRSGWYRAMCQLLDSVSSTTVESHSEAFETLIADSVPRMISLRVHGILTLLSNTIHQKFPLLVGALERAIDSCGLVSKDKEPRPNTDELVHTLRELSGTPEGDEMVSALDPRRVSEAFRNFVERGMYSWANELIAFTSSVSVCRDFFLSGEGLPHLVESTIKSRNWVSFRHLARVVLGDPGLHECLMSVVRSRDEKKTEEDTLDKNWPKKL